jgi:basic membrane lipoprotein Med (substrate-binding protein (PBP1-ABC) superfamily)
MGENVTTSFADNVPENDGACTVIERLAQEGNNVIFTTSPVFRNAALKCALKYPSVKFFNCSEHKPYKHLCNYFGRTYEPRFLTGIIAGSMTRTNLIGYAATSPTPEVISSINAFALGARMVNPYSRIKVTWTREWNSHIKFTDADKKLMDMGTDIISNRNLSVPRDVTTKFGVYSMLCSMNLDERRAEHHLAAPIWNWGFFYENIVKDILNGTYKEITDLFKSTKLVNFWWGVASGVLDIYYSRMYVPADTIKLVELMKKMVVGNLYHPFTGPIYDVRGTLRIEDAHTASNEEILKMKWFVDSVDAEPYPG